MWDEVEIVYIHFKRYRLRLNHASIHHDRSGDPQVFLSKMKQGASLAGMQDNQYFTFINILARSVANDRSLG